MEHWRWLPPEIQTDPKSKILFFGGCAPYFDTFFKNHLGISTSDILADALRLMNFFDIHPAIMQNERCCGHDLLWSGDRDNFLKLARLNVELISEMGIEEVVTACPECYRAFSRDYPENGIETGFKVTHIFELAETRNQQGRNRFLKTQQEDNLSGPLQAQPHTSRMPIAEKSSSTAERQSLSAKCATVELLRFAAAIAPGPDVTATPRPCR